MRRMLTEAVAAEPEPETARAPFEQVVRRRRRRSLRAAVVATALLLTAVVALAGVRGLGDKPSLPAAPSVPPGWKLFQSPAYNLQFHYPPDWVVNGRGGFAIAPSRLNPTGSRPSTVAAPGPMFISLGLSLDYYQFVIQNGTQVTPGSLGGGRAFVRWTGTVSGTHVIAYEIDWGRFCVGRQDCGSHSVSAQIQATDPALLDRYGPIAQRIIGTLAPMRPTQASTGDPARPVCRGDQWRPVFATRSRVAFDRPSWVIGASIQYLHGPPCHLQTSLRLTVERSDGTAVAVAGTPAPLTVEADLPEDGGTPGDLMETATMRYWGWDNWCARALPQARLRITASGGVSATRPIPPRSIQDPRFPCQPSAPWKLLPLP
ncbi:MAG TPA: hypothetical protein VHK02_02830 [Actinomycetota bacterium]|nr:hypothetical protein [Actinomycetota bacterium]